MVSLSCCLSICLCCLPSHLSFSAFLSVSLSLYGMEWHETESSQVSEEQGSGGGKLERPSALAWELSDLFPPMLMILPRLQETQRTQLSTSHCICILSPTHVFEWIWMYMCKQVAVHVCEHACRGQGMRSGIYFLIRDISIF